MKKIVISLFFCLMGMGLHAQFFPGYIEAVRYSQNGMYGSASFMGRAGSIGALGGDFTAASYNPAGLGVFNRSEIFFSPMFGWTTTSSNFRGTPGDNYRLLFKFASVGGVFTFANSPDSKLKKWQIGIGWNRLNDFSNRARVDGTSRSSMIRDEWVNRANGNRIRGLDPFTTRLAFETLLLDTIPGTVDQYWTPIESGMLSHSLNLTESGGINEFNMSFSGNVENFLYFGASMGIPTITYRRTSTYSEFDSQGDMVDFDSFFFDESNSIDGNGINLKLGFIARPMDWVRVGFAYHTPTYYSIRDFYSTSMVARVFGSSFSDDSRRNTSLNPRIDYTLLTPQKLITSLGFVYGNQTTDIAGSFNVDYEYTDFSTMRYNSDGSFHVAQNRLIRDNLKSSHTLRFGGQMNMGPACLRLGYALIDSPYRNSTIQSDQNVYTVGLGYRTKWTYVDFAYTNTTYTTQLPLYESSNPSAVSAFVNNAKNMFVVTWGIRF